MKQYLLVLILTSAIGSMEAQTALGDSIVSLEVNFDLDSFTLTDKQRNRVDSLLSIIPLTVIQKVEVYGHTDSLASVEYNRSLSKRRVQSILAYLVLQGLDPLKVHADYYGEERPKYANSEEERYRNRRCEMYFVIDPSLIPPPEMRLTDLDFKKGDKIRIPNLNFVGNQAIPVSESFDALQDLLVVMKKYPDLRIELHGHVCCGNDHELSVERAKMVYGFLLGNGIEGNRMSYEGFSNTQPLFPEKTQKEKDLNKRVEVYVVANSGVTSPVDDADVKIDLRAPVLSVKFFPQKGRLYPSGHFMLTLITDMMKDQEELFYEFVIYDNIGDARLTKSRVASLERTITDMKVDKKIFRVRDAPKVGNMPTDDNLNLIVVKITKR